MHGFEGLIDRLERFPSALRAACAVVDAADARWKPPTGAWSILEVVAHLGDEESEDFRPRLRSTLEDPARVWTPIDPEGAARDRGYNGRELSAEVDRFVNERRASVAWLRTLVRPDWETAHAHPKWGPISAGMLMSAWAAHDALHLRQIAKRLHELAGRDGAPFDPGYAGPWGA